MMNTIPKVIGGNLDQGNDLPEKMVQGNFRNLVKLQNWSDIRVYISDSRSYRHIHRFESLLSILHLVSQHCKH